MKLSQLIQSAPGADLAPVGEAIGAFDPEIESVVDDSRDVTPGALFVARLGAAYISNAIERGARAVVATPEALSAWQAEWGGRPAPTVAFLTASRPARAFGELVHAHCGWPARSMVMIGVTGTNGKTTITFLIRQLLEASGLRTGLIGTVEVHDGRRSEPASLTTPGAAALAPLLATMAANQCRAVVMEVSSHALDQERTAGVEFGVAVFTNLTGDHLDYHGSMDAYAAAKAKLFEGLAPTATAIVNLQDPGHERMLKACGARRHLGTSVALVAQSGSAAPNSENGSDRGVIRGASGLDVHGEIRGDIHGEIRGADLTGTSVSISGPFGQLDATLPLAGAHNVMNALQAIAVATALGVSRQQIERSIGALRAPPGRLEPVTEATAPFHVFVDYAHSDDALQNVLSTLRPLLPSGARLSVVFGCGGDRDRSKRPRMAAVACRLADLVFVTSDNPRSEDPESIIDEIMTGVSSADRERVQRDCDRERAIRAAISAARPGDAVLIAGKGHENYQIIGKNRRHFDDREIARAALDLPAAVGGVS